MLNDAQIVWVLNGEEAFGVRRAVLNLSSEIRRRNIQVRYLAVRDGSFAQELQRTCLAVEVLQPLPLRAVTGSKVAAAMQAVAVLAQSLRLAIKIKCSDSAKQATHLHVLWPNLVLATALAARIVGAECVWEMANTIGAGRVRPFLYRFVCRALRVRVIANSQYVADSLKAHGWGHFDVPVMYLAAEDSFAGVMPLAKQPPKIAVCIARLSPLKAQDVIIRACADPRLADLRVRIVGSESSLNYGPQLAALVTKTDVGERVSLVGPSSDPSTELRDAGLAICLSRVAEGFGLSVVEAMMAGRPVIATKLGGPGETVLDGVTGWLIGEPTDKIVADAIAEALNQYADWQTMGQTARRHATAHFTSRAQGDRYVTILGG